MNHPSMSRVRELFIYDPETGVLTWRKSAGRKKAGDIAGTKHKHGYTVVNVDSKGYGAHQIIWLYVTGEWPNLIDHINGVRDDNRFANLRHADKAANARNRSADSAKNKLLGAYPLATGGFRAGVTVDGHHIFIGVYATEVEAHEAYLTLRKEIDEAERAARDAIVKKYRKYKIRGLPVGENLFDEVAA
jgi:hypothetical protein